MGTWDPRVIMWGVPQVTCGREAEGFSKITRELISGGNVHAFLIFKLSLMDTGLCAKSTPLSREGWPAWACSLSD